MGQLTEIYNRLGEEFDKASREHFDAALNGKKNGNMLYYHGKMHGIYIAIKIQGPPERSLLFYFSLSSFASSSINVLISLNCL